ncbi:MAG: hypothetical protein AAF193_06790 [Bacteroidota bacterium]
MSAQLDSLLQIKAFDSPSHEILTYSDIAFYAHHQNIPVALEYGQKAIDLASELGSDSLMAVAYRDASYAHMTNGDYQTYLNYSKKSSALWGAVGNDLNQGKANINVAIAFQELGKLDSAMNIYTEMLPLFENSEEPYTLAKIQNNMGNLLLNMERIESAVDYLTNASGTFKHFGDLRNYLTSRSNLANAHMDLGDLDLADQMYSELYEYREDSTLLTYLSETFRGWAILKERQGKLKDAEKLLEELVVVYEDVQSEVGLGYAYTRLAANETKQRKTNQAEEHFAIAKEYLKNNTSLEDQQHFYFQRAKFYELMKDYELALEDQKSYDALQDSILNLNSQEVVIEMEKKLQLVQSEKELLNERAMRAESDLNSRRKSMYLMIFGVMVCIL